MPTGLGDNRREPLFTGNHSMNLRLFLLLVWLITLPATRAQASETNPAGEPIVAPLDSLIPGWQLGVPGMRVGGRRRLTVPAHLAYSGMAALSAISPSVTSGSGAILIPPESTLVFEIELLALGDNAPEAVADISQRPRE